jgi:tRNA/tmRNA/rRNA uracil-C5-methylase (TrmA/RlmC/RlmD family)
MWNNQGRMDSTSPGFVSIVCSTKYMSNAMKKLRAEVEHKKMQQLECERWTKIDDEQQEPVHRTGQKAICRPILGRQREVSNFFAFILKNTAVFEVYFTHVIDYPPVFIVAVV